MSLHSTAAAIAARHYLFIRIPPGCGTVVVLQLFKSCLLLATRTLDPSFHAVLLDMIRDLSPLNLLTASRNAVYWGVLATGHVILEFFQMTFPFATQLIVITINIQCKYHLICNIIPVNL